MESTPLRMQKLLNEMPMCATPPRVPRRPCSVGELLAGLLQPGHVACYLSCADTAMLRAVCSATQLSPLAAWSGHPPFPAVLDSPVRSDRCMDDSASLASPASTRCLELQALLTSPRIRNPSAQELGLLDDDADCEEVAGLQAADCEEVAGLQAALDSSGVYCISDEEPAASLPGSDIVQGLQPKEKACKAAAALVVGVSSRARDMGEDADAIPPEIHWDAENKQWVVEWWEDNAPAETDAESSTPISSFIDVPLPGHKNISWEPKRCRYRVQWMEDGRKRSRTFRSASVGKPDVDRALFSAKAFRSELVERGLLKESQEQPEAWTYVKFDRRRKSYRCQMRVPQGSTKDDRGNKKGKGKRSWVDAGGSFTSRAEALAAGRQLHSQLKKRPRRAAVFCSE